MTKIDSLTSKTFHGFFWSTGGKITNAIAQIVVLAVLARLVNPEGFGLIQAALIVVGLAQLISRMGIGPALVQREELTESHIRVGFTFSLFLGVVLGVIMFVSAPVIASFFNIEGLSLVLRVISLLFVFESFVTVSTSLIERDMRFRERAIIEMFSYIFGYGLVGVVFGYLGYDYWALIFAIFAQQIIKMIAYQIIQKHSFKPLWRKKELNELMYFGGGYTLGKFFNYIALQGDNIIAGRYLGGEALGLYSRAYAIMTKPVSLLGDSLDKVLFPAMAARQNQPEKLEKAFINGSKLITFLSVPISAVIIFSSEEIIGVLLGDNWGATIIPLQILTIGLVFRIGYKIGDSIGRATGRIYNHAIRQSIYAIFMLLGCYIGSRWGINGIAAGVLFAVFINYLLMIGLSLRILSISWVKYLGSILPELIMGAFLSLIFYFLITSIKLVLTSNILIMLVSYCSFTISLLMFFYFWGTKLTFLKILPFYNKIIKYTK